MLSQSMHFNHFWKSQAWLQLNSRTRYECGKYINGVNIIMQNTLCTVTQPTEANESHKEELPEFPDKDTGANKQEDDNFVPPSTSYWIEKCMNHVDNISVKCVVNPIEVIDEKTVVKDAVQSDIEKVSKILNNQFESPDLVVIALDGCNVDVYDGLVEQVLKRFSCEWKQGLGFFKWSEFQKGSKNSPKLYNLIIDNLGKTKKFDLIWGIVEDIKKLEGYVTLDTMTIIMRRLMRSGRHEDAVKTFESLELFGVDKDITALNMLIDAFVEEGSVDQAQRMFSKYKESICPTLHTFNVLVHGWCKSGQIDKAKMTINEMNLQGFQPDMITYTCFIQAYCRVKDFYKVSMTLDEMQEHGCHPSVATYTTIMHALTRAEDAKRAMKIYEKMKENNCPPDAAFYSVLINALSIAGKVKDADAVFEDMLRQGIIPDLWTFNSLIFNAMQDLQEEKALKLLMKMDESQCKPNLYTYIPLLKMCCTLNRTKVISFLLIHASKKGVGLDCGTYCLLVGYFCKTGDLERACFYFKELFVKGLIPMDCTCDTLVKELKKKGMDGEKREIEVLLSSKNFIRMPPEKRRSKKSKSKD